MSLLDPVFNPLLALQPIYVILILSTAITVVITFVYKFATDQNLMKSLRDDMKNMQKEVKALSKHPEKMAEAQKKMLSKNVEYMKHSMKPTLITMLPIILIIGWMSGHLSYMPLFPNTEFNITVDAEGLDNLTLQSQGLTILGDATVTGNEGKFEWTAKGTKGEYILAFSSGDTYAEKKIMISDMQEYENPIEPVKNSKISQIVVGNEKLSPLGNFSLFGWHPSWLAVYITVSLVISITLRKGLKIH